MSESKELGFVWGRMKEGDENALFLLYSNLYQDLVRYGIKICNDPDLSHDSVNQLFLEVWEKRAGLPEVSNVKSYLITYLRRKVFRTIKSEQKSVYLEDEGPAEELQEFSYEQHLISAQKEEIIRQKIRQALDKLTPRQKELIELRFFENLSNEEIADRTALSIKTVYNSIYEGLKVLKQELKQDAHLIFGWLLLYQPFNFDNEALNELS